MFRLNDKITGMFASDKGSRIYDRINDTIRKYSMENKIDGGVLLGFSGGADSVFLLSFFVEYFKRNSLVADLLCVHVNHGIRGDEAKRDEDFAVSFASKLGLEIITKYIDVPKLAKESGIGLEEAARNARYSCFADIIEGRNDISTISVAHNATDNMETVIFNLLRGSGLSGIAGIKPVRDNIIRPLIHISKHEIVSLLEEFDIGYVTDSTNLSSEYNRNFIRNEILPKFERLATNPEQSFTRMTENVLSTLEFIDNEVNVILESVDLEHISVSMLRELHPAIFAPLISNIVYKKCNTHLEEKHINQLLEMIKCDNFALSIPGDYNLICQRGICFFSHKKAENFNESMIFPLTYGENKIHGTNLVVYVGEYDKSSSNVYNFSIHADFSSAIISSGLILRLRKDGDAYKYAGITHKLKKVFNDRNIPPYQRDRIPILCDNEGILWIPGLSLRDGVNGKGSNESIRISFCYAQARDNETEMFTALMRNN